MSDFPRTATWSIGLTEEQVREVHDRATKAYREDVAIIMSVAQEYFDLMESPAIQGLLAFAYNRGIGIVPEGVAAAADMKRQRMREMLTAWTPVNPAAR